MAVTHLTYSTATQFGAALSASLRQFERSIESRNELKAAFALMIVSATSSRRWLASRAARSAANAATISDGSMPNKSSASLIASLTLPRPSCLAGWPAAGRKRRQSVTNITGVHHALRGSIWV